MTLTVVTTVNAYHSIIGPLYSIFQALGKVMGQGCPGLWAKRDVASRVFRMRLTAIEIRASALGGRGRCGCDLSFGTGLRSLLNYYSLQRTTAGSGPVMGDFFFSLGGVVGFGGDQETQPASESTGSQGHLEVKPMTYRLALS